MIIFENTQTVQDLCSSNTIKLVPLKSKYCMRYVQQLILVFDLKNETITELINAHGKKGWHLHLISSI